MSRERSSNRCRWAVRRGASSIRVEVFGIRRNSKRPSRLCQLDGPYADTHVSESLVAYDYRAGSTDGDNLKMRRAYELGLPIILLRKIKIAIYVPVFPAYVVADDRTIVGS